MQNTTAALVIVACGTTAFGQNLIVNGSFESTEQAGPTRVSITELTDWTASAGFMLLERGFNGISFTTAQSGEQFVTMGHNNATGDTLFQRFGTVPGASYDVSFWTKSVQGAGAGQGLLVQALDDTAFGPLGEADIIVDSADWVETTFSFTAVTSTTELRFVHTGVSSTANLALDSVSVVPAPAGAVTLAMCSLAASRRRR
ncbi:MAG: DUF642 domain-containing protein [Planctomycetota bacterium]